MNTALRTVYDLALFAHVVESGNISQCAKNLGLERSTVSRRIRRLENELGTRLLERTTRYVAVTEVGRRCYEQSATILRAAKSAQTLATEGALREPEGPVTLVAPVSIVESILGPVLDDIRAAYREVDIDLQLNEYPPDCDDLEHDLALAIGPISIKGALRQRIAMLPQVMCASTDYLQAHAAPRVIDELAEHKCIADLATSSEASWKLQRNGRYERVPVNIHYKVEGLLQVRQAVIAGLGVACLPVFMCDNYVESGELTIVLPEYDPLPRNLFLLSPRASVPSQNSTILRVALEAALKNFN